jgi:hypothetical protein
LIDKVLAYNGKVVFSTMEFDDQRLMRPTHDAILNATALTKRLKTLPLIMTVSGEVSMQTCPNEDVQRCMMENSFNDFISIDTRTTPVERSASEHRSKNYSLDFSVKHMLNAKTIKRYMLEGFRMTQFSTPLTEETFASSITTNPLYSKLNVVEDYLKCCRSYVFERV